MSFNYTSQDLSTEQIIAGYVHLIVKELFKLANSDKKQLRRYANAQHNNTAGSSAYWKANMAADMCSAHYRDTLADINQLDKAYNLRQKFENDERYKFLSKYLDVLDDYQTNYPEEAKKDD